MLVTEDAFYQIIQDTWDSTLRFQVGRPLPTQLSPGEGLTVSVSISGAWEGKVLLHCPTPLARLIAAATFQLDAESPGEEEMLDALGELVHIIGGNLKALLPQPVTLSLPVISDPPDSAHAAPRWPQVCRLALETQGHPFVVSLLGEFPAAVETPAQADGDKQWKTP